MIWDLLITKQYFFGNIRFVKEIKNKPIFEADPKLFAITKNLVKQRVKNFCSCIEANAGVRIKEISKPQHIGEVQHFFAM